MLKTNQQILAENPTALITTELGWQNAIGALVQFPMLPLAEALRVLPAWLRQDKLLLRRIEILASGSIVAVGIKDQTAEPSNTSSPSGPPTSLRPQLVPQTDVQEYRLILCSCALEAHSWRQAGVAERNTMSCQQPAKNPEN